MKCVALFVALLAAAQVLAHPGSAIAVSADGQVFFVDTGGGIFSVRGGKLTKIDGPAFHWFALDAAHRFQRLPSIPDGEMRYAGPLIMSSDVPLAIGSDGVLYYPLGKRIMGRSGVHATLPGTIQWINDLAAGPNGTLYYTEDAAVRKIDARGRVSTVAERVSVANCVAIPGNTKPLLRGLAVAPDGTVYVAASGCGALLKIDPHGRVAPLLRTSAPWAPTAVAVAGGEVYVLEYSHTAADDRRQWIPRIRKISRTGTVTTLVPAGATRR